MTTKLFRRLSLAIPVALAGGVLVAAPAHAWQVSITITGAGQVTETTTANLVGSGCVTSANNPTGAVGMTCLAGTPDGPYGSGWTVRYRAIPKPGYRFVRWESPNTSQGVICDGANGSHTYTGEYCQFATWQNLSVTAVFADVTNPEVTSLSGPSQPVNGPARFEFTTAASDTTFRSFQCRMAGYHDWQTCSSPHSADPSASGNYTLDVRAVDWSGNVSAARSWNWTVDKTPPSISVTAPADGSYDSDGSVDITGVTEPSTKVELYLDSDPIRAAQVFSDSAGNWSTGVVGWQDGAHTFYVRATDSVGNVSSATATRTVTVDTVDPAAPEIDSPALARSYDIDGTVVPSGTAEPRSVVTILDGITQVAQVTTSEEGDWIRTLTNVAEGSHTYTATASDAAGNSSPGSATRTVIVDLTAPTATIVSPQGGATGVSMTANVVAQFSEPMKPASINGLTVFLIRRADSTKVAAQVTYDGRTKRVQIDPTAELTAGTFYTAKVTTRVKDRAGNNLSQGLSWSFKTQG